MPVTVSYPGVYVQEISSGSHAIAGVPTSVTAFVGRTFLGPVNTPTALSSFADFQRMFGGLNRGYPLSYAVHDFFQNGGGEAVVVRLYTPSYSQAYPQAQALADASDSATDVAGVVIKSLGGSTPLTQDLISTANAVAEAYAPATYPGGAGKAGVQAAAASGMVTWLANYFTAHPTAAVTKLTSDADAAAQGPVAAEAAPVALSTVLVQAPPGLADAIIGALAVQGAAVEAAVAGHTTNAQTVLGAATAAAANLPAGAQRAAGRALATALQLAWAASSADTAVQLAAAASTSTAGSPSLVTQAVAGSLGLTPAAGAAAGPGLDAAAAVYALAAAVTTGAAADVQKAVKGADLSSPAAAVKVWQAMEISADDDVAAGVAVTTMLADLQTAAAAAVAGVLPSLVLDASSPGNWPNSVLGVSFDQANVPGPTYFNLRVAYTPLVGSPAAEQFTGVSLQPDAGVNRLDRVLATQSNLLRFTAIDYTHAQVSVPPLPVPGAAGTASGGSAGFPLTELDYLGDQNAKTGLYALDHFDLFNLLVIPPDSWPADQQPPWMQGVFQTAAAYCQQRRAFLLVDPPPAWTDDWDQGQVSEIQITDLGSYGQEGRNAAVYFPNLREGDPLQNGATVTMAPSAAIAGIYARTDAARGVWKAPAGINDGAISGVSGVSLRLTDFENGLLNPQGINCLRSFPVYGTVVWGARTLKGADGLSDDYKYVPVRRLALFMEESLYRGTQWAVFEPNAEPLWASLRLAVGSFMSGLFRQGAFAGTSAGQAYSVRCDATTTTQDDIDHGVVNVQVGFAPLKPAEFVVITIQQIAGQIQT